MTLFFLAACCVVDLRRREIPNRLSGAAAALGLAANTWLFGSVGLIGSILGLLIATAILLPPFAVGGVGGGDVKMMAAVGALLGPVLVLHALVFGMIVGGIFAIAQAARLSRLTGTLRDTFEMVRDTVVTRSLAPLRIPSERADGITLPYSLPLALGTLASLYRASASTWQGG